MKSLLQLADKIYAEVSIVTELQSKWYVIEVFSCGLPIVAVRATKFDSAIRKATKQLLKDQRDT